MLPNKFSPHVAVAQGLFIFILALTLSLLQSSPAHAAPQSAIRINADSVVLDKQSNSSRYTGNVVLMQDDMKLTADSLTVYTRKSRLDRVVAHGNPAVLDSESDNGRSMHGEADSIEYTAKTRTITLTGHARLVQDGNTIQSKRIKYDVASGTLKAGAPKQGGRVEVILLPPEE